VREVDSIREDLDKLLHWSHKWQMPFNTEKCKVMHFGHDNAKVDYILEGNILDKVSEEKDLGVVICDNLKVSKQCRIAAKKGYQILGLIYRTFVSKNKNIIIKLYKSLVRPHLDYCIQAWRPYLKKDIEVLEGVQRRATRMIVECKDMEYDERLRSSGLTTLETRRIRADLIEVYRIMNGLDGGKQQLFGGQMHSDVSLSTMETRGHPYKLSKRSCRLDIAKYSFGNRVVADWNRLPGHIVLSNNVDTFKGRLDKFLVHTRGFE
jgi:ribonucleases P/MRP protein subunit RPP40